MPLQPAKVKNSARPAIRQLCGKQVCPYCGAACPTAELEEKATDVIEQAEEELKDAAEAEVTEAEEVTETVKTEEAAPEAEVSEETDTQEVVEEAEETATESEEKTE